MKDLVCGMDVDPAEAQTTRYQEKVYYFCREQCAKTFAQDPLRYTDKSKSAASLEGTPEAGKTPEGRRRVQ